jgi:hypothetical protein
MDHTQLVELARQVLTYMAPLITAGALAKVGENSVDSTKSLAQRTWSTLQRLFQDNEDAQDVLALYQRKPDNVGRAQVVEGEIITVLEQQPQAVTDLQALVEEARRLGLLPSAGRSHSQVIKDNAQVGVAVAGDVQGGVTLNQPRGDIVHGDKVGGDKVQGDKIVHYGAPRPADTHPDHIKRLIDINTRRLRVLEEQAGRFGYSVPPHVQMEIEDVRAEITRLKELLKS